MRAALLFVFLAAFAPAGAQTVTVGGKNFTEGYVLTEILAQTLERAGMEVVRRPGLGGTKICFEALRNGEIDIYPEYTGTLNQALLDLGSNATETETQAALARLGLQSLAELGFNNTYGLVVRRGLAADLGLSRISDLRAQPDLRTAFSHEFLERPDGWRTLAEQYGLGQQPRGIEHGLAYQGLLAGELDLMDAYTTDGELSHEDLLLLEDDRGFFPTYLAVPLARNDLPAGAREAIATLAGSLNESSMRVLNRKARANPQEIPRLASAFLDQLNPDLEGGFAPPPLERIRSRLSRNVFRHLQLTLTALVLACIVGIAIGLTVWRRPRTAGACLQVAGIMQTVPSIALLALMVPLLGLGMGPAVTALFLYSLLPIMRNTITGLRSIDPVYQLVGRAMGLTGRQQMRHILLPLAMPHVLSGIRTAAVISIGTATLAAFIGAGGLGDPIVTGLALNDTGLILEGAIPAALLAVVTELGFGLLERSLVPAHLRSAGTA